MLNAHDAPADRPVVPARERCYLIPGDSPLGYRLPLDSQPWAAKSDYPTSIRLTRTPARFSASHRI